MNSMDKESKLLNLMRLLSECDQKIATLQNEKNSITRQILEIQSNIKQENHNNFNGQQLLKG